MKPVVVVGGGIAGLSAARRLNELGVPTIVLEANEVAGGRMTSVQSKSGTWYDLGAEIISDRETGFLKYARELGFDGELRPYGSGTGVEFSIQRDGVCHEVDMMNPASVARLGAVSAMGKARMIAALPAFVRARRMAVGDGREHEVWRSAALDDKSVGEWLGNTSPELTEYLIEPTYDLLCGWQPEEMSRAYLLHVLTNFARVKTYTFTEGVGMLARKLADSLDVRTGCAVSSVDIDTLTVSFESAGESAGQDNAIEASGVVVAVTGDRVADITRGLDAARERFFRSVRYVPHSHMFFELDGDLGEDIPYRLFPRRENAELASAGTIGAPTDPTHTVFRAGPKSTVDRRMIDATDDDVVSVVKSQLDALWPGISGKLVEPVVCRWRSALPNFAVGHVRRLASFWALPEIPGIAFAGDYLTSSSTGGAHHSGVKAAEHVAANH